MKAHKFFSSQKIFCRRLSLVTAQHTAGPKKVRVCFHIALTPNRELLHSETCFAQPNSREEQWSERQGNFIRGDRLILLEDVHFGIAGAGHCASVGENPPIQT